MKYDRIGLPNDEHSQVLVSFLKAGYLEV